MTMAEAPASRLAELFFDSKHTHSEVSQELERNFFDCLRAKNGVYMTTYAHRLDNLNAWVEDYLPSTVPLRILDVGISCGVSTLEWAQSLEQSGLEYEMTGVELTTRGIMISFGSRLHVVVDCNKRPLLFEIDGEWMSNPPRKRHLLRYFFPLTLMKSALWIWERRNRKSEGIAAQTILGMKVRMQNISLVTPRLANHPHVTIREGNIMTDSWHPRFHVVRAANILNRGYFDDSSLTKILSNLRRHLAAGGLLVVCRTNDQEKVNRASIFRLNEEQRFERLSTMNGGSEIESLVLQLPAPETREREQIFAGL